MHARLCRRFLTSCQVLLCVLVHCSGAFQMHYDCNKWGTCFLASGRGFSSVVCNARVLPRSGGKKGRVMSRFDSTMA